MTGLTSALLTLAIFIAAVLYSSVGHAGASGYLAAMALGGVPPEVMKPTALALNIVVASIASLRFYRAGSFRWELFWPFAVTSVPAALLGGALAVGPGAYRLLLGLILIYSALRLILPSPSAGAEPARAVPLPLALAAGALIGLLSGMIGVGGGIFLSPLLILAGWATPRHAAGVSAVFILVNSLAGLAGHTASLQLLPLEALWWAPAAALGGVIGSGIGSRRLGGPGMRRMLGVVLIVAGVKMLLT